MSHEAEDFTQSTFFKNLCTGLQNIKSDEEVSQLIDSFTNIAKVATLGIREGFEKPVVVVYIESPMSSNVLVSMLNMIKGVFEIKVIAVPREIDLCILDKDTAIKQLEGVLETLRNL